VKCEDHNVYGSLNFRIWNWFRTITNSACISGCNNNCLIAVSGANISRCYVQWTALARGGILQGTLCMYRYFCACSFLFCCDHSIWILVHLWAWCAPVFCYCTL